MFTYDRQISISAAGSRRAAQWPTQTLWWSELADRLRTPARGTETLADYLQLPKPQQDDLKDVGGFVAGVLKDGRRKANAVAGRDVLTLDLDHIPAGGTETVLRGVDALGCAYAVYSTRKHSEAGPRLRVLLPLSRTVTADEYEPLARKLAACIDPSMAPFDPSTFEASRLMYWPSCCADSRYVFTFGDKPFLDADGVLAMYPDWHNVSTWPQVPGAAQAPVRLAARQGDPEEKGGVVGAFCRAYDVLAAMDIFLPGIYEPVDNDPDRYTYTAGSTTGGAIVYDGGKFLFSHHATDPCGGRLVNAFDLVRLHKFGAQDDDADPRLPTNRLPSYVAMKELAAADKTVKADLLARKWDEAAEAFGGAPAVAAATQSNDNDWKQALMINSQGQPEKSMRNLQVVLEHDPRIRDRLRLNLFSGHIDISGELPWKRPGTTKTWGDDDAAQLRIYLEPFFGKVPKNDVLDAVAACASDQAYHPVRDYLQGLTWDGVARLDTIFIEYLGAEDCEYVRAVTRKALTAAVARVMRPGCKYDTMLVLVGTQGRHKSTILAKMGGDWFSDSLRTFGDKDAMETIQGTWINEVAEMQAMAKAEVDAVKMFLSKTNDYYRAAYGRYIADRPRQCVFFGTTNSKECLIDPSGGRRFWVVDIDQRPRKKNVFQDLDRERNQLWAEAVMRWRLGEPLHLPPELEKVAKLVQEDHRARHPWEGIIAGFLDQEIPEEWMQWDISQRQMFRGGGAHGDHRAAPRNRVCAMEIWCEALGKPKGDLSQRITREINGLLERVPGWASVGVRFAGKPYDKQRCFERKTATDGTATL